MLDKADKLMAELSQSPIIDILGIIGPTGSAGVRLPEKDWTLTFKLSAWKKIDGEITTQELTIRKPVSHDELKSLMKELRPYEIVHLQARVPMENGFGTLQGVLVQIVRKNFADVDLDRCRVEIQKPVVYRDERLGEFILDRRIGWFEGAINWGPDQIKLHLKPVQQNLERCLKTAYALYDSQNTWTQRAAEIAVTKLLPIKNESWLQDDEESLSAEQFLSRMQLESITVGPENIELWYNDGDLFWGHSIRVSGSLSEGPTFAGIEG
jgi:hypothetical protein